MPIAKNMSKENLEQREVHESILIEEKLIEESGMKPEDWIAKNGKKFRKIINDHPEFTDEYGKNPEEVKKKIKKMLEEMKK
jgi:hypothetical protein